jgi:[acyl-carrier-protein] S-malonyltransferase
MGKMLCEQFDVARQTFQEADESLGFKISQLCFEGDEEALKKTEITQPAILTTSVAAFRALKTLLPNLAPTYAAGHSLGEWSALTAVGALSFGDAVRLVHQRGRFMQVAVKPGDGAMSAIIGLESEIIRETCNTLSETEGVCVSAANFNGPSQTVISGEANAVAKAEDILKEKGAAKVARLAVSAPFHCALMQPAADEMKIALENIDVSALSCPVISNVEAQPNQDPQRVVELLVRQITAPVRWVETVQTLVSAGETLAIELGSGRVLAGLNRRIDRSLKTMSGNDAASFEKVCAALESA